MSKGISNVGYLKRSERLNKVGEMLDNGIAPTQIAEQLGVGHNVVKSDIELIAVISKGSLSPELCAEKRISMDDRFSTLTEEAISKYTELMGKKAYKPAVDMFNSAIKLQKLIMKLWGLDGSLGPTTVAPTQINVSNMDVKLTPKESRKIKGIISRKDQNLSLYE